MKKTMLVVLVMIIFYAGITLAGQQIRVRVFDTIEWGGDNSYGWLERKCSNYCNDRNDSVDSYFANGWQVVTQRPIIITKKPMVSFGYSRQFEGYCKCVGVEYILDSGG